MSTARSYQLKFFREWFLDIGYEDLRLQGTIDEARALARSTLERLARDRAGRMRPRTAMVVEAETGELAAIFRLSDDGPAELRFGAPTNPDSASLPPNSLPIADRPVRHVPSAPRHRPARYFGGSRRHRH